eukprot:519197_1
MNETSIPIYYHGIGKEFIFEGTSFNIFGPLSTTSLYSIANGRFAKSDGLVVDIINDKMGQFLWDCTYWSDFPEESEILFLGSLFLFEFRSIHDIAAKLDYENLIRPISMFGRMIRGYPYQQCEIKKQDMLCLREYISIVLNEGFVKRTIGTYCMRLFENWINQVYNVEINMEE